MNRLLLLLLLLALAAVPAAAYDFPAADLSAARALIQTAQGHRAIRMSHEEGILQQINAALGHLTEVTKPSVAMVITQNGSGTGFVVEASGLMITNVHVVLESGLRSKVKVMFPDKTEYEGVVMALGTMGTDKNPFYGRDLAIIALPKRDQPWPALALGDSSTLREGHMVAMMGYPLGLPFTTTQGVVGGLDQREGGLKGFPVKFVQSDAAINPGNSGGPLLSMDGKVMGVNTLSFSRTGGSDGLGFSVGVDAVKAFIAEYKRRGSFSDNMPKAIKRAPGALTVSCPSMDALSKPWVEHSGPAPRAVIERHLGAELDGAAPLLLTVNGMSWWVGGARRGRGDESAGLGCLALGTGAVYVNGPEDQPATDFVQVVASGGEKTLRASLIEVRWLDPKDGRKHRWYDTALARRLGWDVDGRGAPTDQPRPIPLPDAVNELL